MLGWTCEDNMAAIADNPFPRPEALGAKPEAVSMINNAMILYLQAVSAFVKTVRNDDLYISPSTTYDQLAIYNAKYHNSGGSSKTPQSTVVVSKSERSDKIPAFSIPKFTGDRMDGKSWIDSVERKFRGSGAINYLADGEYCDDNDEISSALTSRLLDSIAESDILS